MCECVRGECVRGECARGDLSNLRKSGGATPSPLLVVVELYQPFFPMPPQGLGGEGEVGMARWERRECVWRP